VGLEAICIKFPNTSPSINARITLRENSLWGVFPLFFYIIINLFFKSKEITSTRKVHSANQSHSRNEVEHCNSKKHVPAIGRAYGKKRRLLS